MKPKHGQRVLFNLTKKSIEALRARKAETGEDMTAQVQEAIDRTVAGWEKSRMERQSRNRQCRV